MHNIYIGSLFYIVYVMWIILALSWWAVCMQMSQVKVFALNTLVKTVMYNWNNC